MLDVALRVGKLIEENMGAEVIYTRSDDTFIPLEGRTAIANEKKADLFLSIHANSSPISRIAGVETYYLNFSDAKDALDVAARENASSQKSIFELQDIIQKITLHEKLDESREFAATHPGGAVFVFGAQHSRAEESRREKGAVRGADRRQHAERAGGDRLPEQSARRGAPEEAGLPAETGRIAVPRHRQIRGGAQPLPDGRQLGCASWPSATCLSKARACIEAVLQSRGIALEYADLHAPGAAAARLDRV